MRKYCGFISYAHPYQEWVKVFHSNLESALRHHGETREVFLDEVDLGSGQPWITQLQAGLSRADHFILVVTPEAMASPWVKAELDGFMVENREGWREGSLHLAHLVWTPLPAFLKSLQLVDFQKGARSHYESSLRKLLAGLLGAPNPRKLPRLPEGIEIPEPLEEVLPTAWRKKLVGTLGKALERELRSFVVGEALNLKRDLLERQPSPECAASYAFVQATGDDDPVAAGQRIALGLRRALDSTDPDLAEALGALGEELTRLTRPNPDDSLLQKWLRHMADCHRHLVPYFGQKAELTVLDRVYVPLFLSHEVKAPRGRGGARAQEDMLAGLPGGHTRLRDLLALGGEEDSRVTGRWVVKGDPGAGKTTLLRHLAAELAGEENPPWVPVLESLPKLVALGQGLLERVEDKFRKATRKGKALTRVLDQKGQEGRLLVLLDGLDEVPRESREDVEIMIREVSSTWPRSPVVVTTRPIGYQPFDHRFVELELQPLDRERRLEFLARWFGRREGVLEADQAADALEQLEGSPTLWDLSGNPLYLTLIALLLEEGKAPDPNRTRLYDQVFDLLLDGKHRGPDARRIPRKDAVHEALRYLGYAMTLENRDVESEGEIEDRLIRKELAPLRKRLESFHRWRDDLRAFLHELAEKTGILGEHDGPGAGWKFWHRSFREALAAEQLEAKYREGGEKELLEHATQIAGQEGQWAEPYALLTGRLEEPDTLVRSLVRVNRTLGLRALATAQTLADETIREVLELTDDPDERGKVFQRLPELVGEGERTLQLIDRLRRGVRNGDDLFFLDLAVRQVAKQWPDQAGAAEQLLARFFDHIPVPDPDLFRWVETPKDGKVGLWCDIPAGSFLMGSPEDEEGGNAWERPTHEVHITHPFQVAAVPMTNRQYQAFDPEHPWYRWKGVDKEELAHHPVVNVSWWAAVSFCRWLASRIPGLEGARLAAEAEWEYACRAGTQTPYWSGKSEKDLGKVGWYDNNSGSRTHRVGKKKANAFGLYDVHGNVWEWTVSPDTEDYSGREAGIEHDPRQAEGTSAADLAAASGGSRVIRGGGIRVTADGARSAFRNWWYPGFRIWSLGFRVVVPVAPEFGLGQ